MKRILLAGLMLASLGAGAQTMKDVTGCWKMPSREGEAMQLEEDGSFNLNDYSAMSKSFVLLYGTWSLKGKTVTLMYDERKQQRFTLKKDKGGNWILTKVDGFKFIKSTSGDCL
jgi:hypothetical protein